MSDTPSDMAQILALLQKQAEQSRYLAQLRVQRAWDEEMKKPRHADPKRLVRYGYKVYCQNDEDGIIAEIFRRIGTESRTFVEFGVETGVECNSVKLLVEYLHGAGYVAFDIPKWLSLGLIVVIFGAALAYSMMQEKKERAR